MAGLATTSERARLFRPTPSDWVLRLHPGFLGLAGITHRSVLLGVILEPGRILLEVVPEERWSRERHRVQIRDSVRRYRRRQRQQRRATAPKL